MGFCGFCSFLRRKHISQQTYFIRCEICPLANLRTVKKVQGKSALWLKGIKTFLHKPSVSILVLIENRTPPSEEIEKKNNKMTIYKRVGGVKGNQHRGRGNVQELNNSWDPLPALDLMGYEREWLSELRVVGERHEAGTEAWVEECND